MPLSNDLRYDERVRALLDRHGSSESSTRIRDGHARDLRLRTALIVSAIGIAVLVLVLLVP